MANEIEFEIVARLDSVEKSLSDLQDKADKAGNTITTSLIKADIIIEAAKKVFSFIVGGFEEAISSSMEYQDAINRVNNSLLVSGRYTDEVAKSYEDFAVSIQNTTRLSDTAVLSGLALSNTFAKSAEQAKALTAAAIDLADATGVDVNTAITQLGQTLSGSAGRLSRIIPQLKELTTTELASGAAIDIVAKRFAGMASGEVNTFGGAIAQLKNQWEDLFKAFGNVITTSPAVVAAIKFISTWVSDMVKRFTDVTSKDGDVMKPFLENAINVAEFLNGILTPILDVIVQGLKNTLIAIGGVGSAIMKLFARDFEGAKDTFLDSFKQFQEPLKLSGTESAQSFLDGMRTALDNSQAVTQSAKKNAAQVQETYNGISFTKFREAFQMTAGQMNESAKNLINQLKGTFATGLSGAFSAMGAALVKGQNVFGAFGKAILGMFGDLALQLGQFYLLLGLADLWLHPAAGAGEIAAGAALSVLGGALKAIAGSGGGASSTAASTSGASSQAAPLGQSSSSLQQPQQRQVGTNVAVNIAGSVLGDKRTLGREVADALNEAFGTNGITIARGAIV